MLHVENTDSLIDCSYNTRPNYGITMLLNLKKRMDKHTHRHFKEAVLKILCYATR